MKGLPAIICCVLLLQPVVLRAGDAETSSSQYEPDKPNDPGAIPVESLTADELQRYGFTEQPDSTRPRISDLNISQQYTLSRQRKEFMALLARHLGVLSLRGTREDLKVFQTVVDRKVIAADELYEWQTMGVVFGDLLASQFGLDWVSYEDERGVSRALRRPGTDNFVFPVTLFSKRVRFKEAIDIQAIYDGLASDIEQFKHLPVAPATRTR